MNLVLDFGNSSHKFAIFESNELMRFHSFLRINGRTILRLCSGYQIESVILSSVIRIEDTLMQFLEKNYSLIALDESTPLPIINLYETPATLGNDRLACAVAASKLFPGKPVLSIDAGTCIKYDFITKKGEYLGGAISPGIKMRFKAMHDQTARLPLPEMTEPHGFIGRNTNDSLLSGVIYGAISEAEGMIERYNQEYTDLQVILTGGDSAYFDNKLKSRTFAVPHLVLKGLNYILNYNAVKKK